MVPALVALVVTVLGAMGLVMTVTTEVTVVTGPVIGLAMVLLMMAMSSTVAVISIYDQR